MNTKNSYSNGKLAATVAEITKNQYSASKCRKAVETYVETLNNGERHKGRSVLTAETCERGKDWCVEYLKGNAQRKPAESKAQCIPTQAPSTAAGNVLADYKAKAENALAEYNTYKDKAERLESLLADKANADNTVAAAQAKADSIAAKIDKLINGDTAPTPPTPTPPNDNDDVSSNSKAESHDNGQLFTSTELADKLVGYAVGEGLNADSKVLDCCAGKGALLKAAIRAGVEPCNIYAIEFASKVHAELVRILSGIGVPKGNIRLGNALDDSAYDFGGFGKFDFILTNPPYGTRNPGNTKIRYVIIDSALEHCDTVLSLQPRSPRNPKELPYYEYISLAEMASFRYGNGDGEDFPQPLAIVGNRAPYNNHIIEDVGECMKYTRLLEKEKGNTPIKLSGGLGAFNFHGKPSRIIPKNGKAVRFMVSKEHYDNLVHNLRVFEPLYRLINTNSMGFSKKCCKFVMPPFGRKYTFAELCDLFQVNVPMYEMFDRLYHDRLNYDNSQSLKMAA